MREITEYQKIIEFSEQVLAGKHPRVKLPSHLVSPSLFSTTSNSLTSVFKVAKPKTVQPFVPPAPRQKKKSRATVLDTRDIGVIWGEGVEGGRRVDMPAEDGDFVRAWDYGEERDV
jgi:hypothetical protein